MLGNSVEAVPERGLLDPPPVEPAAPARAAEASLDAVNSDPATEFRES
ncbi:hypothetical protein ACIRD3_00310 [Kitasatospora sp. NPDC093550]